MYSLKEILLCTLIYAFCTLSILGNTLVFPNIIRWKVQATFDRGELERDFRTLIKEQYLVSLTNCFKYNSVFAENREHYLNQLKNSTFNKNGILSHYLTIQNELQEITADLYLHNHEKYERNKELLNNWENANKIYNVYGMHESPFNLYFPSKAVEKAYWQKKHELLGYLQPDSMRIAQFILSKNWQKEFKEQLIWDLDLSIILQSNLSYLENIRGIISESPIIQGLYKKYHTSVHKGQTDFHKLVYKVRNSYIFHDSNSFFKINTFYNHYLYTYKSWFGEEFLDELSTLDDLDKSNPQFSYKEEIDWNVVVLLNEKMVDKKTFECVKLEKVFDYQFLTGILLVLMYILIVLWSKLYSLRNFFISAFLLFFGFMGVIFSFVITTNFIRLDMPDRAFFIVFFPSLIGLFALILSIWIFMQNHNKAILRFLSLFLHLASLVCFVVTSLFAFFAQPYQSGELTPYGHLYNTLDVAIYLYPALFLLNIYLYGLYQYLIRRPLGS
ncbi:MAG: hypothetical protein NW226_22280 [Microscillaceae bacterium]|nr:hypothetical protein [Microscillaceae bacterium]